MTRSYPEPPRRYPPAPLPERSSRPRPTLPDPFRRELPPWHGKGDPRLFTDYEPKSHRRPPERQWNCLQVAALILVIEALCFVAFLWGQR